MMSWDVWLRCYNERGSELMFEATSILTQQLEKSLEKKGFSIKSSLYICDFRVLGGWAYRSE